MPQVPEIHSWPLVRGWTASNRQAEGSLDSFGCLSGRLSCALAAAANQDRESQMQRRFEKGCLQRGLARPLAASRVQHPGYCILREVWHKDPSLSDPKGACQICNGRSPNFQDQSSSQGGCTSHWLSCRALACTGIAQTCPLRSQFPVRSSVCVQHTRASKVWKEFSLLVQS